MVDDSVDDAVEDDVCEGDATSKDPDNDETGLSFLFCCSSLDVEVEVVVLKEEVLVEPVFLVWPASFLIRLLWYVH